MAQREEDIGHFRGQSDFHREAFDRSMRELTNTLADHEASTSASKPKSAFGIAA